MNITSTTYNVKFGNDPEKVGADIYRLAQHTDVIVCQEAWPDKFAGVWANLPAGWRAIHLAGADELVILYNASRLTLSHAQVRQLIGHADSPTPGIAKARYALAASFIGPDGHPLTVIGSHMPLGQSERLRQASAALADFAREFGRRVIVGADWNTDQRRRGNIVARAFAGGRLHLSAPHTPTRGRSVLDAFWSDLSSVETWIGSGFSSDHRPVTTTFRL